MTYIDHTSAGSTVQLVSPQLKAFHCVATQGSVHGAARALKLTQTAVTHRLHGLEAELGASLFIRSRRGMELTDAGRALLIYCRQIIELEGETLARITGEARLEPAVLRIQGTSSILRSRIIPTVHELIRSFAQVTLEFSLSDGDGGVDALKAGAVDFAILTRDTVVNEFDSKLLKPERYLLVGPKAWEHRSLATILAEERIVDFDASDQLTLRLLDKYELRAKARPERHFANNTDALASMVVNGLGYSSLALEFAQPLLDAGKLVVVGGRKFLDCEMALAWYPRKHMPPHFAAVTRGIC